MIKFQIHKLVLLVGYDLDLCSKCEHNLLKIFLKDSRHFGKGFCAVHLHLLWDCGYYWVRIKSCQQKVWGGKASFLHPSDEERWQRLVQVLHLFQEN